MEQSATLATLTAPDLRYDPNERRALVFKALSIPSHLRIIEQLRIQPRYVTELACLLNMSQEGISHALKRLMDAGIVTCEPRPHQKAWPKRCFLLTPQVIWDTVEELAPPPQSKRRGTA